jgi:hypothetical protein
MLSMTTTPDGQQIAIGYVERLDEGMTARDLCEVLDQVSHRRDADRHVFLLDRGVRKFLSDLLRERLPRSSLRPQSPPQSQPRVRRIKREVAP